MLLDQTPATTQSALNGNGVSGALGSRPRLFAAPLAIGLSILGSAAIWPVWTMLWALWTTDALKSIGMIVPVISFLLVLRCWRSLAWEMDGSWWGFALLVLTAVAVQLRQGAVIVLVLGPQWNLYFPPLSLVVLCYGVGVALLFGGTRLVRAAWFPLLLLLLVNPVPHVFNVFVDLPLQRASAHIARAFAVALGQPLSPDKLRLMFTPTFGMFIAPGCNGIRGAVTMGLIALVAGYLYRFRLRAHLLTVTCAILLGYVFNFIRLCVLVLYYIVALPFPWLQQRAEGADYIIGGALFFVAVYLLTIVIGRLGNVQDSVLELPPAALPRRPASGGTTQFALRAAALTAVSLFGIAQEFRSRAAAASAMRGAEDAAQAQFPQNIGNFKLTRTWDERLVGGALLFHWADYTSGAGDPSISLGVSPSFGAHDTLICHSARGDDPVWSGQDTLPTAGPQTAFSAAFFSDGSTQSLEASTICTDTTCGEFATPRAHFGFVYSRPHPEALFSQNPARPIPILLKVETLDTTLPPAQARAQLTAALTSFVAGVDLNALTSPYRRH